jgi:hypothetical protein
MRRSALITSVLLALAGSALLFASSSVAGSARKAVIPAATVGIGDEQPSTFGNPAFLSLRTRIARYVTPYDVATNNSHNDLPRLRAWLAGAARDHIQPLIAFYHSDRTPKRMPSLKTYTADVKAFLKKFPQVKTFQPWNEANRGYVSAGGGSYQSPSASQSAAYYLAVRTLCHGCTIVGLDVLDSTDPAATVRYIKEFKRALGRHAAPTLWGLHNYSDTNRFRSTGTRAVLGATSGQVWLTETGGIAKLAPSFPFNLSRQTRATRYMFSLAGISRRITRLYIFQWTGAGGRSAKVRFDAGLTDSRGRPRPAFCAVYQQLRNSKRCPFKTVSD